jgi:hypothetical protein
MSNPERHYSDIFSVADFKVTACGEGASTINVGSLMFLDPPMPSSKKPVVGGAAAGVVAKDGDADAEVDVLGRQPNAYAQSACVEKQEAAAVDRGIEDGAKRVLLDAEGEASVDDDGDVLAEKIPVVKACYRLASAANAAAVEYAAAQAARDAVLARHAAEACEMARRHAEAEEAADHSVSAGRVWSLRRRRCSTCTRPTRPT